MKWAWRHSIIFEWRKKKKGFERDVNILFITRTADYPGAPVGFSQQGKKESADYSHWWINHPKTTENRAKKFENSNVKLCRGRFNPGIFF